jgi:hypothetical protein
MPRPNGSLLYSLALPTPLSMATIPTHPYWYRPVMLGSVLLHLKSTLGAQNFPKILSNHLSGIPTFGQKSNRSFCKCEDICIWVLFCVNYSSASLWESQFWKSLNILKMAQKLSCLFFAVILSQKTTLSSWSRLAQKKFVCSSFLWFSVLLLSLSILFLLFLLYFPVCCYIIGPQWQFFHNPSPCYCQTTAWRG